MILTVGNIKGGIGKSTLATNITVFLSTLCGPGTVLAIDGDKQGTSAGFAVARTQRLGDAGYSCVRALGKELFNQVHTMRSKFEHIIIDAGGQDNPSLRAAMAVSEILLVPVVPSSFELWSLKEMNQLLDEAEAINPNLKICAAINLGFSQGEDNEEMRQILLNDFDRMHLIDCVLVRRKEWSNAGGLGLSIIDKPCKNKLAVGEFAALMAGLGVSSNDIQSVVN